MRWMKHAGHWHLVPRARPRALGIDKSGRLDGGTSGPVRPVRLWVVAGLATVVVGWALVSARRTS